MLTILTTAFCSENLRKHKKHQKIDETLNRDIEEDTLEYRKKLKETKGAKKLQIIDESLDRDMVKEDTPEHPQELKEKKGAKNDDAEIRLKTKVAEKEEVPLRGL